MKRICTYSLLFCLVVSLTACPYREVYKAISKEQIDIQGSKVNATTLFYNSRKRISTCNVGFKIENPTDSIQKIQFFKGFLTNSKNKLIIEKIYDLGDWYPPDHVFTILPKRTTILGLAFKDSTKNFGDTVNVHFSLSDAGHNDFIYTKNNR